MRKLIEKPALLIAGTGLAGFATGIVATIYLIVGCNRDNLVADIALDDYCHVASSDVFLGLLAPLSGLAVAVAGLTGARRDSPRPSVAGFALAGVIAIQVLIVVPVLVLSPT
jgi:hypothetical protein